MKKIVRTVALGLAAVGTAAVIASPASAAGQVCYDVQVNAAGQSVVAQAGCQDLP